MCSRKLNRPVRAPHHKGPVANDDCEISSGTALVLPQVSRTVPSLAGKKALIVTDDRDMKIEKIVTKMVMDDAGLGEDSGPFPYSEFFSATPKADVLILRSSREFSRQPGRLIDALERFRRENPSSAVIVLTFEHHIAERLAPLLASGVVNAVEIRPPIDDLALLRMGGEILGKLQPF